MGCNKMRLSDGVSERVYRRKEVGGEPKKETRGLETRREDTEKREVDTKNCKYV